MKKILIADDHSEIIELLNDTLCDENYELSFTENGKKAVLLAKKTQPDLIIMDIMMPGSINGLDATQIIASDPICINCKIMILSAKGKDTDKIQAIKAGASAFVEKPFSPQILLNKIESLLNN